MRTKRIVAVVAAAATMIPAAALAATPVSGGSYSGKKIQFSVASDGKSMLFDTTYCKNKQETVTIKIKKDGSFAFNGNSNQKKHVTVNGKFVTSHKAKGTQKVAGCSAKPWTATYSPNTLGP